MEIQLQELIEQIKKDGVDAAETQAASIIEQAKAEAEQTILNAKAEAEKIILAAKSENERLVRVSEDAIKQAGRNLLISFRESVNKELNAIISSNITAAYSPDHLSALILKAVDTWVTHTDAEDISVLLNGEDLKMLEETLLAMLKEKMLTGVTLKANDDMDGGFRIAVDHGSAYYDYSTQAVTEMLSTYLNPRVTALMKEVEEI